jgi:hypothetical protein
VAHAATHAARSEWWFEASRVMAPLEERPWWSSPRKSTPRQRGEARGGAAAVYAADAADHGSAVAGADGHRAAIAATSLRSG